MRSYAVALTRLPLAHRQGRGPDPAHLHGQFRRKEYPLLCHVPALQTTPEVFLWVRRGWAAGGENFPRLKSDPLIIHCCHTPPRSSTAVTGILQRSCKKNGKPASTRKPRKRADTRPCGRATTVQSEWAAPTTREGRNNPYPHAVPPYRRAGQPESASPGAIKWRSRD